MFKLLNKKKNNKGFTLVELVIVVAILAILVGLLAPQYTKYVEKSRQSADVNNMEELVKAIEVYSADRVTTKNTAAAENITLKLATTGLTITSDVTDSKTATNAFSEYVPKYEQIVRKGHQWTDDPTVVVTISKEGKVTAAYSPDDFETAAGLKKVAKNNG